MRYAAVLAALTAQLLGVAHYSLVRHRVCVHGEEIEVTAAAASASAAAPTRARTPALSAHDPSAEHAALEPAHCTFALHARTTLPAAAPPLRAPAPSGTPATTPRSPLAPRASVLALAPKTSPPASRAAPLHRS